MVYKEYIKRGNKIFGPYYCESYRDENGILISRLELINGTLKKLNVQMLIETEYCLYCYDGQLNYDEDEIDCVYDGNSCQICREEKPLLKETYSLVFILLVASSVLFFILIIWHLILLRKTRKYLRKKEHKKKIMNISKLSIRKNFKRFIKSKIGYRLFIFLGLLISVMIVFQVIAPFNFSVYTPEKSSNFLASLFNAYFFDFSIYNNSRINHMDCL